MRTIFARVTTACVRKFESERKLLNGRHCVSLGFAPKRTAHSRKYMSRIFINLGNPQPNDAELVCKSHKLLLYNGVISPGHLGAFHLLPVGLRALEKLVRLIDEELQAIGCEKVSLTTLTPKHLWKKTGRWELMGSELFRIQDRNDGEFCLGPTHEEALTELVKSQSPVSYRRLPLMLYQVTRKFRDEMAPKYGLLRGREFEMKDLYTFDVNKEEARETYEKVCEVYRRIFNRLQLKCVRGDSGAIGGDLSHEFHLPANIGQDKLLLCSDCGLGWNKELVESVGLEPCSRSGCGPNIKEQSGIEVGHAFYLGTKYSSALDATFISEAGKPELMEMGCYGLGVTRILQGAVEVLSPDNQIRWPSVIAPYQVLIIPQKDGYKADECMELSECLSDRLSGHNTLSGDIVIDDRTTMTIGKRIYEAKRMGFPYIVVAGKKVLETPPLFEVIDTSTGETYHLTEDQLYDQLTSVINLSIQR